MDKCYCGSDQLFSACCKPYLQGKAAPTAEALMRSRYTAYVKRDAAYLHRTWAAETRPSKSQLLGMAKSEWLGLQIVRTEQGTGQDQAGLVEFIARYHEQGVVQELHEVSLFRREKGRWVYFRALETALN